MNFSALVLIFGFVCECVCVFSHENSTANYYRLWAFRADLWSIPLKMPHSNRPGGLIKPHFSFECPSQTYWLVNINWNYCISRPINGISMDFCPLTLLIKRDKVFAINCLFRIYILVCVCHFKGRLRVCVFAHVLYVAGWMFDWTTQSQIQRGLLSPLAEASERKKKMSRWVMSKD